MKDEKAARDPANAPSTGTNKVRWPEEGISEFNPSCFNRPLASVVPPGRRKASLWDIPPGASLRAFCEYWRKKRSSKLING